MFQLSWSTAEPLNVILATPLGHSIYCATMHLDGPAPKTSANIRRVNFPLRNVKSAGRSGASYRRTRRKVDFSSQLPSHRSWALAYPTSGAVSNCVFTRFYTKAVNLLITYWRAHQRASSHPNEAFLIIAAEHHRSMDAVNAESSNR